MAATKTSVPFCGLMRPEHPATSRPGRMSATGPSAAKRRRSTPCSTSVAGTWRKAALRALVATTRFMRRSSQRV